MRTSVASDVVLLAGSGSVSGPETVAVFVRVPVVAAATVTVMATVSVCPASMAPSEHVTTPPTSEHEPTEGVADTNVIATGRVSVTVTAGLGEGPRLDTVSV